MSRLPFLRVSDAIYQDAAQPNALILAVIP
jgi:hypothetical protein